jgi:hypothetical protein
MSVHDYPFYQGFLKIILLQPFYFSSRLVHTKGLHAEGLHFMVFFLKFKRVGMTILEKGVEYFYTPGGSSVLMVTCSTKMIFGAFLRPSFNTHEVQI